MGAPGTYAICKAVMKPNHEVSSIQAIELQSRQMATWPLAAKNHRALESAQVRSFDMGGFTVKVQFNPARILSSGAKVDTKSIRERRCFLCPDHLPAEQGRLAFGSRYLLLTNPYPIFQQHFTIPSVEHARQQIADRFNDLLEIARCLDRFTIFYNGPKCGASAPDHAHFQAVTRSVMPMDYEMEQQLQLYGQTVWQEPDGSIRALTHYLRNGFVIRAHSQETADRLFRKIYRVLEIKPDEYEPRMNLFGSYEKETWTIVLIPRRQHRPWQYEAEGDDRLVSSPGAADIGGLFIAARQEDFAKITPDLLRDIYTQVCLNDEEIGRITREIQNS